MHRYLSVDFERTNSSEPIARQNLMLNIAILTGSTRPGRNNEAVARWVYELSHSRKDARFELVDIAESKLPLLDEPIPPSLNKYTNPHTLRFAEKIGSF